MVNLIDYIKALRLAFINKLKHEILYQLKDYYFKFKLTGEYDGIKNKKKAILMLTPTHSNLGEQAIAYAEVKFINNLKACYEIIEVPINKVYSKIKEVKSVLNKEDIIVIIGGGNMGDVYGGEESRRRFIIKKIRNNKIISLPQTINFSDSAYGKLQLKKSRKIYSNHPNLTLVARETISYDIMCKVFNKNRVILTPDIVLSLDLTGDSDRYGIVTCFRKDGEKSIDSRFVKELIKKLRRNYSMVTISDTINEIDVDYSIRDRELTKKWNEFRSAEVVITDRLHGMIFCAITGTPCIVFSNSNNMVTASYNNWLIGLEHIKLVEIRSVNEIMRLVAKLKKLKKPLKIPDINNCYLPLINEFVVKGQGLRNNSTN